jgi:hypothetical protein
VHVQNWACVFAYLGWEGCGNKIDLILCSVNIYSVITFAGPQAWGLGKELTTPHRKKTARYETLHRASELTSSCEHGNEPSSSIKRGKFRV